MNRSDSITLEYEKHPAFSFEGKPYSVDLSKIMAFDKAYKWVAASSNAEDDAFQNAKRSLTSQLSLIFNEMRVQIDDEYEQLFLDELKAKVTNLLNEEISFFRLGHKQKKKKYPELCNLKLLESDRYFFGSLSNIATARIQNASSDSIRILRDRVLQGKLTRQDLSFNTGKVTVQIAKILNKEFALNGVLDAVSKYMGGNYNVGGLALELSVPNATWWKNLLEVNVPPKTMYAHLDESIIYPKAIVYISDVGDKNGPTSCYPGAYESLRLNALQELIGRIVGEVGNAGHSKLKEYYGKSYHQSMSSERFRRHFMRLPPELRFNSHFGWDVLPDSNTEKRLQKSQKTMIGNAGTYIIFDGARLLHRGGLLEEGDRIALQVIFEPIPSMLKKIVKLPRRVMSKIKRFVK